MIYIPRDATSEQALEIVRAWIDLLAREDYHAALTEIGIWGIHGDWTPEFLRDDIQNYRSPELYPGETQFRVTDWRTAQGGNPQPEQSVTWYDDTLLTGAVDFDLSLYGRWSDLTANFVIFREDDSEAGNILMLEEFYFEGRYAAEAMETEPPAV